MRVHWSVIIALRLLLALAVAVPAGAAPLGGVYVSDGAAGGRLTLDLRQLPDGRVEGELSGNGARLKVQAKFEDEVIVGFLSGDGERMAFEAELDGDDLGMEIFALSPDGQINYDDSRELDFRRQAGAASVQGRPLKAPKAAPARGAGDGGLAGTFSGPQLTIRLSGGDGGVYQGEAVYQGQRVPLQVQGRDGSYSGYYEDQGQRYPLQIALDGDAVVVTTGGARYQLSRGTAGAAGAQAARPAAGGQGLDDGSALGRQWSNMLAGKQVTRMSSYSSGSSGGYSSRTDVHLCRNGSFTMRGNSSVSVDVGGAYGYSGGNRGGDGRWQVITEGQRAGVRLTYGSGEVELYELSYSGGKTYANGERVFVVQSGVCP